MSSTLDQIVSEARLRVAAQKRSIDMKSLERDAERHFPRGFRAALEQAAKTSPAIIAELKKASPSKGLIRPDFQTVPLAAELALAGATALSVLTEEQHFRGSLANLRYASSAVSIPCLRKDFIVDELQIIEARAHQADAILLIVASLSQTELVALHKAATRTGLDTLCEVHDEQELHRAIDAGCETIGVNSRNLHTFEVSLTTAEELGGKLPPHVLRVAESGIHTAADIRRLRSAGYHAFLIGETLMRAVHPGEALRELLETQPAKSSGDLGAAVDPISMASKRR